MTPLRCEHCGQPLFERDADANLLLHAGGMVREVHGVCRCGHGYHWSACERTLEKVQDKYNQLMDMLTRYIEEKKVIGEEFAKWTR